MLISILPVTRSFTVCFRFQPSKQILATKTKVWCTRHTQSWHRKREARKHKQTIWVAFGNEVVRAGVVAGSRTEPDVSVVLRSGRGYYIPLLKAALTAPALHTAVIAFNNKLRARGQSDRGIVHRRGIYKSSRGAQSKRAHLHAADIIWAYWY